MSSIVIVLNGFTAVRVGVARVVAVFGLFRQTFVDYSGKFGELEETATVLVHGPDAITIEVLAEAIIVQRA
jgi:ribosome recycling factor